MTTPTRTPYAHKIRYGITGAPTLTEDALDGSYAPGVGVAPVLIELVYSAAMEDRPASVAAAVTGVWTRFGEREQPERTVTVHFKSGPDGWPEWLAAEARLHDPEPAVSSAVVAPPTNQTAPSHRAGLRDEIVNALGRITTTPPVAHRRSQADHVLAVLYREWPWLRAEAEDAAPTDQAALRDRIAAAVEQLHQTGGLYALDAGEAGRIADAVLAVLPPTDRAAIRDRTAEAALAAVETALGDTLAADAREEALAGIAAVLPATDRAAVLAETLIERCPDHGCVEPAWEDGCHCEIVPLLRRPDDEQPGARHVHITIHHPDPTTATTAAQAITTDAQDTGAAPHRPADETPDTTTARGCPPDCSCRAVCIGTLKPAAGARQDGAQQ